MTELHSIALFGYDRRWSRCLASHETYAARHGYHRVLIRPPSSDLRDAADAAWHKIDLMLGSLRRGDKALWLDADCEVSPTCPAIAAVEQVGRSVYMGLGHSQRFNSGVIYALPTPDAISFFETVRNSRGRPIAAADRTRYENGYVIATARRYQGSIAVLDVRWNNTQWPALDDYIRHYTGPMRSQMS